MRSLLFVVAAALVGCFSDQRGTNSGDVAITHVSVIDVVDGTLLEDQAVVIVGNRIERVVPVADLVLSPETIEVPAQGKFVVPGLWDMHVHTVSHELDLLLEIANGVTGVRDMGGSDQYPPPGNWGITFDSLRTWRTAVLAGSMIGPRIVAGGIALDGPQPFWPQTISLKDPAHATAIVDSLAQEGVDFLKVYMLIPPDILSAIASAARTHDLEFAGHPSQFVSIDQSATLGQRTFEHADALEPVYYDSLNLRAFMLRASQPAFTQDVRAPYMSRALGTYSDAGLVPVAAALRTAGSWLDPTLVTMRSLACIREELRPEYTPSAIRQAWEARMAARCGAGVDSLHLERWAHQIAALGAMHREGVGILAGSDAWNPFVVPGFSLHEELALLVGYGLSPLEALRAATFNAAQALNMADSVGTIGSNKVADLVILDANPLEDIRNTQSIHAVIANGRLFRRADLDELLSRARSFVR